MHRLYLLGIILLLTGCAVTDKGKKPAPVAGQPGVYDFTVYFGNADKQEVQAYANNIAAKLNKEKKCVSYQLENVSHKLWIDRSSSYRVTLTCK